MSDGRGYQGLHCSCKACQALTEEQREAKHKRIQEARQRGGKTRAAQPSMQEARSKGFWTTWELHGLFARGHLRKKIKRQNQQRAVRKLLTPRPMRPRRPMQKKRFQQGKRGKP